MLSAAIIAGLVVTACGSDAKQPPRSSSTTRRSTTSSTRSTSTTGATTSTTSGCPAAGAMVDVRDDFPNRMSPLTGKDVRTGSHPCFERFVIELQSGDQPGTGFPGYWVRYATEPLTLSPSGQPITVRGTAALLVSLGAPMKWMNSIGYTGPQDVFPTSGPIKEYRLTEDFEGQSMWTLGLDQRRNFEVTKLSDPPRLVVDIRTAP